MVMNTNKIEDDILLYKSLNKLVKKKERKGR